MSKDDFQADDLEEGAAASRFGREAKIGLAVILVLSIVFVVVLTMKLRGSSSDQAVVAAGQSGENKSGASKTDALLKDAQWAQPQSTTPTIVTPKTASTQSPKSSVKDLDSWKHSSERKHAKKSGGGAALDAPPSFAPEPPKPRYDRYRDVEDRYAKSSVSEDRSDGLKPLGNARSDMRLLAPDPAMPHAPPESSQDESGGFAMAAAEPPPPYRENSRYDDSSLPRSSGSRYSDLSRMEPSDRSSLAMPVAQYGDNDYRRRSLDSRPFSGRPRHTPSYNNPPQRNDGKYEVQPNDSYWTISERLFGTGAYFKALAEANRGRGTGEDNLRPGELILAPSVAELEKSYPDLCPKPERREALQSQERSRTTTVSTRNHYGGRTYTVAEGDTLFNIARYELGKASRWAEIYDLNRDVLGKDFNYLTPGTQLVLPEGERTDSIAQPPTNTYRR